ncbi:carbohydrate ABC transporter permease [Paenibacillus humicola]|uniref:carbohydrate ABC transporter permease n=1 Tax=Paenibacillus humicola TaxID=3110540 RepID=UPI00237BEA4A|nr:sugar ABC transporter permease [Paenibacillus humicola]
MLTSKLTNRRFKDRVQFSSLLLPAVIFYCAFVIVPLLGAFFYSATDWDGKTGGFHLIGLKNYAGLMSDAYVWHTLGATMKYTVAVTVFQNALALFLAVALDQSLKTKHLLRTLIFIICTLSPLITGYIWSFMYSDPLMTLGRFLGIDVLANNILGSRPFAIYAAAFASIWRSAGWTMVIYLAGLQIIPKDLVEAASVDGVNAWQKLRSITIPLLAPAITVNIVLTFERGLKDFDTIFALTGGGPGDSTSIIALSIYRETFFFSRAGYGTAVGILLFILIIICTLIQLKFLRRREEDVS